MENKYHATLILADGTKDEKHLPQKPDLKTMQDWVGGYIEVVGGRKENKNIMMIINEEGRLNGLDVNKEATTLFVDWLRHEDRVSPIENIVGVVIVCNNFELD